MTGPIRPGLCSITFRALPAETVVAVAARAGVEGIEWGADGHAPPGDTATADALAARCRDAGIMVVSYGSYLGMGPPRAGEHDRDLVAAVCDSAEALGAPMVRLWTEFGVTDDHADRDRVVDRTAALADAIAARGLAPALEFHPFTLTESATSAVRLLDRIDHPALRTHWQPDPALAPEAALAELRRVAGRLAHLHVFAWGPDGIADRHPLADGAALWPAALDLAATDGAPLPGPRFALCEYVRTDDPEQLVADVATLRDWLDALP